MTNDQDDSFQIVLIDIQKAANREIQCVKKPLADELKYVAISYRWGELQELNIDTHVGYLASITSFNINDFYKLCSVMSKEPDLKSMDYVWVDAICVNQSSDERKATIHHMTDIYERATWILAVPDLHAEHLWSMHTSVMRTVQQRQAYTYHLLHDHTSILDEMDHAFFDTIDVPQVPYLRQLLTRNRDYYAVGFQEAGLLTLTFKDVRTIEDIYNNNKSRTAGFIGRDLSGNQTPHQCDKVDWLLEYFQKAGEWTRLISNRSMEIHQIMYFLTNLMIDWSSRVWVISEFHISKKKNNLKFWFNQLAPFEDTIPFFTFDMDDQRFTRIRTRNIPKRRYPNTSDPLYIEFYQQLTNQLNRQSFLEMMLKSKASKNEDRFYAIFPFFPEYKHLLQKEELDNMNSILSVKLKLYQVMTNEHKLQLLYLSSRGTTTLTLQAFATSAIRWPQTNDHHVDLTTPVEITLLYQETVGYYLRVKPTKYVLKRDVRVFDVGELKTLHQLLYPKTLREDGVWTCIDELLLFGTVPTPIKLIGSFNENIWILSGCLTEANIEPTEDLPDDCPGFRVY